jgi:PKD repeat protein
MRTDAVSPTPVHNGPYFGVEGEELRFDGKASHDSSGIQKYEWDFGDGSKSEGAAVKHTFKNDGTYAVKFKVTDKMGNWKWVEIPAKIENVPPILDALNSSIQETCVSVDGIFSDVGMLDKHSAMIDWGDGATTLGNITEENGSGTIKADHAYKDSGKYNVEVKLYDNNSYDSTILPVQVTKHFDYAIELESKELVIERGNTGMNSVSIKVSSCSPEQVALQANGLPEGTAAEFSSPNDDTSFASMIVISTTPEAKLGEQMITVRATGGGVTRTEYFMLKIVEPQAPQNDVRQVILHVLISSNEQSGQEPLDVTFQAIVAGGKPPYIWTIDYGDGSKDTVTTDGIKIETSHQYMKGEHEAKFTVKDSNGSTGMSDSLNITVNSPLIEETDSDVMDRIKVFTTSIIEETKFDPTQGSIAILASGPDGTTGSISLTIPKTLLSPPFTVNINGEDKDFDLLEEPDSYIMSFSYPHSTELIRVTGTPVQSNSLISESSDSITVVQISKPPAMGAGNVNALDFENSLLPSNLSVAGAAASWLLALIGAGIAGTVYYTAVARKHHARRPAEHALLENVKKIIINVIPRSVTLSPGESITFYAQAFDEENNELHDIDFTWSTTVKDAQLICEARSAQFIAPGDANTGDTKLFGVRKGEVVVSYGNVAASADVEVHES